MVYIIHMIRTQVYLPEELYQNISLVAEKEKKAKAEVIRQALEESLAKKRKSVGATLMELAKLGKKLNIKGPKDLSTNHDKYLYEE